MGVIFKNNVMYGAGSSSNIISYVTDVTTTQYGWINPVLDKDGNPLTENDVILNIGVLSNTGQQYYGLFWTGTNVNDNFKWIAKLINVNSWNIVGSAVSLKVRITYIHYTTS